MNPHPVATGAPPIAAAASEPRLLERFRQAAEVRGDSRPTVENLVSWARAFILFHNKRHPREMGLAEVTHFLEHVVKTAAEPLLALAQARAAEVEQFLTHLAVEEHISASSQNQALNALVFLYAQVLEMDLGQFNAVRARRGQRLPVVLAPEEVRLVLGHVVGAQGLFQLMARLLYGCGLRVSECCGLRVHDLDFGRGQIMVRGGKGNNNDLHARGAEGAGGGDEPAGFAGGRDGRSDRGGGGGEPAVAANEYH